jgi:hypothetical protein
MEAKPRFLQERRHIPEDGILHFQEKVSGPLQLYLLHSMFLLLVAASVVPSSPILITLMMEAIRSFETSVLIRTTFFIVRALQGGSLCIAL